MNTNKQYFNLVANVIYQCFTPLSITKTEWQTKKIKEIRRDFANTKMIELFCDCSDNFEFSKLKNKIIEHNK